MEQESKKKKQSSIHSQKSLCQILSLTAILTLFPCDSFAVGPIICMCKEQYKLLSAKARKMCQQQYKLLNGTTRKENNIYE